MVLIDLAVLLAGWAPASPWLEAQPSNKPLEQKLLSATSDGTAANGISTNASISIDGGFVVFESTATDLSRFDPDRDADVYIHDVSDGAVSLVSFAPSRFPGVPGAKGDGPSHFPSVSRGGARVVFASDSTNLTGDKTTAQTDIFLQERERGNGELLLVSVTPAGTEGDGPSDRGVINADGDVIAFQSLATDLLKGAAPPRGVYRIYIHVVGKGNLGRIDPPGGFANGHCRLPQLSADGRFVAFESDATNLSPLDSTSSTDVYVLDRRTSQITLVSVGARGDRAGDKPSSKPRISPDGRFVAFESLADDLVGGDTNALADVFVRDLVEGRTERVSLGATGRELRLPSAVAGISMDGRFVGFVTEARIIAEDSNGVDDFCVRDRAYSRSFLVSGIQPAVGGPFQVGNGASTLGSISGDGQVYSYQSLATNLAAGRDGTRTPDIYRAVIPQAPLESFPPSNHVFLNLRGALRQFNLDGTETGKLLSSTEILARSFAVDDRNALWVLSDRVLARYKANTFEAAEPARGAIVVNPIPEPGTVFALAAGGGYAFAAIGSRIWRFSADGEAISTQVFGAGGGVPDQVSLALDPSGLLWVCAGARGQTSILKLDRGLRRLSLSTRIDPDQDFETIAIDAQGALVLRSRTQVAKLSRQGGVIWKAPVKGGGGLAVDAAGNIYTVTPAQVLGFHPDGRLFLRFPNPDGIGKAVLARIWMGIDGLGDIYAAEEGGGAVYQFRPADRTPALKRFASGAVAFFGGGDATGFLAANVHAQKRDADHDGILNRDETRDLSNPFDPSDPSPARRLPAVLNLTATLLPGRQARLDWHSPVRFAQFFVFRDGRQLPQSPVSFLDSLDGVIDPSVPAGVHVYRVIGQGAGGGGAGGGLGADDPIPEPYSASSEASVAQGDGSLKASISTPSPPDAVAYESSSSSFYAVLSGGTLWKLSNSLQLIEETTLPADPFGETEVRGLAADTSAAGGLYLLLGDGRLYKKSAAGSPTLALTLSQAPEGFPFPEGFTGLAVTSGNGNDLFTTMAGPGIDCLIGFLRTSGVFKNGAERSVSETIDTPVDYSAGVSGLGNTGFLAGIAFDLDGAPPSINRVVKLDLGSNFDVQDAGSSVPLGGLGSFDIPGFDLAPGLGLIVADRTASRIALLEALFPGSLDILEVKPNKIRWRGSPEEVQIRGTGFGANVADLDVKFDGTSIPIKSLVGGVITVEAPEVDEAREITIEVSSSTDSDFIFPGLTYGFLRGDANDDETVNISDPVMILAYLFNGDSAPPCKDAADPDDNEDIQITDAVYLLNFLFLGTPAPQVPFPGIGADTGDGPDGDILGCGE